MIRMSVVLLSVLLLAAPVLAQEGKENQGEGMEMPAPPQPLDNAFLNWMVGEWEGWTKSQMGQSKDWMKCEMGLNGQFLMMDYSSDMGGAGDFHGMGAITLKDGALKGYWIDVMRTMSQGSGTLEGDSKSTMQWTDAMGSHTRITEKLGEDKMRVTIKVTGPDGKPMEAMSEITRKKP